MDSSSDSGWRGAAPQRIALGKADHILVKDMDRIRTTRRGD